LRYKRLNYIFAALKYLLMIKTFGTPSFYKSKKLFIISLFCSCLFASVYAQEKDTIITQNKIILCQIYAIEQGKVRYREKGVGKIMSCSDIVRTSYPWKHKIDSINKAANVVPNTVDITKFGDTIKYCEIMGIGSGKDVFVTIDYGQRIKTTFMGLIKVSDFIIGKDGRIKTFNSMIDALNFMVLNGWEFVSAYAVNENATLGGSGTVYHYLLHRK
jgi:hypothetical protein